MRRMLILLVLLGLANSACGQAIPQYIVISATPQPAAPASATPLPPQRAYCDPEEVMAWSDIVLPLGDETSAYMDALAAQAEAGNIDGMVDVAISAEAFFVFASATVAASNPPPCVAETNELEVGAFNAFVQAMSAVIAGDLESATTYMQSGTVLIRRATAALPGSE